tara:strand:- start:2735 stop:3361 length:627 start_codon:yes stop_codon:yes gene_type:complete
MDEYEKKIEEFFLNELRNINNPKIVEFGVRHGISTKKFIEICENNNGFLNSFDIHDCSKVSNSKKWKFHQSRDDNFDYIDSKISNDIDLIYLDSFHNALHVKKIIYHYYPKLKLNGVFVIDDISWLPYIKNKKNNNFHCEINNQETFERLLEIKSSNDENIDLFFSFVGSGSAKIIKRNNENLNKSQRLVLRKSSIKNKLRKLLNLIN